MWVYLRDVIDENHFHNNVHEFSPSVNKWNYWKAPFELLQIMCVETELNNAVNDTQSHNNFDTMILHVFIVA